MENGDLMTNYRHISINAGILPLVAADGVAITTIEALGNPRDGLHAIQVSKHAPTSLDLTLL